MADQLQLRRGTTAQIATFTGAQGEVIVDTDKDTLVVQDGATPGGFPLASESAVVDGTFYYNDDVSGGSIADSYILSPKANTNIANSYMDGQQYGFVTANANTGPSTATFSALGVRSLKWPGGIDPVAGEISGRVYLIFDATNNWFEIQDIERSTDFVDTLRVNVASTATVDLTTSAPSTRHINITGTTTITGFTIESGDCYFVRFDGALTLTSGASLVTQTGANIVTVAGDTCILRATADNVVELLSYCRVQRLTSGTAVATTSGTSHDFTSIPSWVKRITVSLSGVSTSGTSNLQIQLGTSGGVTITGYVSAATTPDGSTATQSSTSGMLITEQTNAATYTFMGSVMVSIVSGNTWVASGVIGSSEPRVSSSAGTVTLSSALDRIRLTTVNGTDTFDAGTINIIYEG